MMGVILLALYFLFAKKGNSKENFSWVAVLLLSLISRLRVVGGTFLVLVMQLGHDTIVPLNNIYLYMYFIV